MAPPNQDPSAPHLLVVIDHQEAKVYRTEIHGAVPQRLEPYEAEGHVRYTYAANEWADDRKQPKWRNFYEAIAKTLRGAEQILLFGSGTGKSSAMDQLFADLKDHHRDVAAKIIGTVVVDAQHLTENQLLAKARDFYSTYNEK